MAKRTFYGVRLADESATVGQVYQVVRGVFEARTAVFSDAPWFETFHTFSEDEEAEYESQVVHLEEDRVVWGEGLVSRYLHEVSGDCGAFLYSKAYGADAPGFGEMKWEVACSIWDSSLLEVFSPLQTVVSHIGSVLQCEPVEYPGLLYEPETTRLM